MKKWLLPLLCTLPVIGIGLWYLVGKNPGNFALAALFLACPLSHVFLMKHGDHEKHDHKNNQKKSS